MAETLCIVAELRTEHFDTHVAELCVVLSGKLDALIDAPEYFGETAEFAGAKGEIFLRVRLPPEVDYNPAGRRRPLSPSSRAGKWRAPMPDVGSGSVMQIRRSRPSAAV